MLSWWDLPWCIEGDFKVTSFPSERSVEAHFCPAMVEFVDFIVDHGLMDNPFVGGNAHLVEQSAPSNLVKNR